MILKRNFNIVRVFNYVKTEVLFAALVSTSVYVFHSHGLILLTLPFSVAGILGSALAIFIAFRNNSSYGRWWEARTIWGGIVNSSRVLARLIITFTDSHAHQANYDRERSEAFKQRLIFALIGWVHALRIHLRSQSDWSDLKPFFPQDEFALISNTDNKPNMIQLLIGKEIYKAMANGILGGFDSFQMEGQLLALANYQGSCERIKNTPLLRQYDYFTRVFLFVFILLLPFALIGDFMRLDIGIWMIPISTIISFVFAIIGKVGEVNEDPFENRITDVPLTSLSNTIERNLLEMLGDKNLPALTVPNDGILM